MDTEIWKPVPKFETLYAVSSLGRVQRTAPGRRTYPGKILTPLWHGDGYQVVELTKAGVHHTRYVHRLVALAFLPVDPTRNEVNHIDGNKSNPALSNLEWVNESEQRLHAWRLNPHKGRKLTVDKVRAIRSGLATGATGKSLALAFGVCPAVISQIRTGKIWLSVK